MSATSHMPINEPLRAQYTVTARQIRLSTTSKASRNRLYVVVRPAAVRTSGRRSLPNVTSKSVAAVPASVISRPAAN